MLLRTRGVTVVKSETREPPIALASAGLHQPDRNTTVALARGPRDWEWQSLGTWHLLIYNSFFEIYNSFSFYPLHSFLLNSYCSPIFVSFCWFMYVSGCDRLLLGPYTIEIHLYCISRPCVIIFQIHREGSVEMVCEATTLESSLIFLGLSVMIWMIMN